MESVEEVINAITEFPKNVQSLGLTPKGLAYLIGYDGWYAVRSWINRQVYPPADIAVAIAKMAQYLRDNPMPQYVPNKRRNSYSSRILVEGVCNMKLPAQAKDGRFMRDTVEKGPCSEKQSKTTPSSPTT